MLKSHIARIVRLIRAKLGCCMILVVGCDHGIQYGEDPLCDTPAKTQQKARFAGLVDGMIKDNEIEFVGEEWGLEERSAAHVIAESSSQVLWANINTSFAELAEMRIPNDYADGHYTAEQKAEWNRQREQVMIRKLLEHRGTANRMVVVCGFDHMEALAESLRRICKCAKAVDYRRRDWYDENAFLH